jgi:hypothetical protein
MTQRRVYMNLFFNDRHKVKKKVSFFNTDIKSVKNDTTQADIKSFFNTTTDIKSFFQTAIKSADVVSFLKNWHKVRKNDTMSADLKTENFFRRWKKSEKMTQCMQTYCQKKITDIVEADTKSGSRKWIYILNFIPVF